jgi:hypothetical protein
MRGRARKACLGLCASGAGYTVLDVCDFKLPDEANLRHIAQHSTRSTFAQAFGLRSQDVYDYIKRVVLGQERLDLVFAEADDAIILTFKMTGHILGAYHPEDLSVWDYLNRIEEMTGVAAAADMNVLPALILRLQWHGRAPGRDACSSRPRRGTAAVRASARQRVGQRPRRSSSGLIVGMPR